MKPELALLLFDAMPGNLAPDRLRGMRLTPFPAPRGGPMGRAAPRVSPGRSPHRPGGCP